MKNRRGFNPDARVKDADFAFRILGDSVFTKGFLGPSLRENNGLPSVGVSAARRAGVIVDENGKMRCPPGTPNANQFTDINMSNCMIPSAETVAQEAADAVKAAAEKSVDGFKRGRFGKSKPRENVPIASLAFANSRGILEQRRVQKGNSVKSPIDGSERQLNTVDDSIQHIAEGGPLSEIPDEHLVRAIISNSNMPTENGPREGSRRFSLVGQGGGMHGMTRFQDTTTGAYIGVKYNNGKSSTDGEAIREIAAELFLEHLGYEPMPMRLVMDVNDRGGFESWDGAALVTELAHNRYDGEVKSAYLEFGDDYNLEGKDILRMMFVDGVLKNKDRHDGNFMIAETPGGDSLIPIDHSLSLEVPFSEYEQVQHSIARPGGITMQGLQRILEQYYEQGGRDKLEKEIAEIQEELRMIDTEQLSQDLQQLLFHAGTIGVGRNDSEKEGMTAMIPRIGLMTNPADISVIADMLAPEMLRPEYLKNPPSPATLDEWVSADRPTVA